jgi:hypothetical protein
MAKRGEVVGFRCLVSGFGLVLCSKVQNFETRPSRVVNIEVSALNITMFSIIVDLGVRGGIFVLFETCFKYAKILLALNMKARILSLDSL